MDKLCSANVSPSVLYISKLAKTNQKSSKTSQKNNFFLYFKKFDFYMKILGIQKFEIFSHCSNFC